MPCRVSKGIVDGEAGDRAGLMKARTSMVDGFPYKEEVGGSSPSAPTKRQKSVVRSQRSEKNKS